MRLLSTLKTLRDLGNTVLVVEHDEDTIRSADYIVDLGPGAGRHGGEVVAAGTIDEILAHSDSLTGAYLRGERRIEIPRVRRPPDPERMLRLKGASGHNLTAVNASLPLGTFICVTGVSGSGKSTLINETLYRELARHFYGAKVLPLEHDGIEGLDLIDKVIDVDQSPIGRTPRSNPATYTGVFTPIRELFAELPEAKMRGYEPGIACLNLFAGNSLGDTGFNLIG
jgi:excinuclease ABC subunit A